jgi:hypothetical protein
VKYEGKDVIPELLEEEINKKPSSLSSQVTFEFPQI